MLVAALGALAAPSWAATTSAADNVPCWKRLLNDWYDGTINKVYPIPCYQQAIKHLPPETEIYGSAKEDIQRAEQAAILHRQAPPEQGGGSSTTGSSAAQTPPQTTTTTTTTVSNGTTSTGTAVVVVPPQSTSSPKKKKHGISGALADITPGDPQAFPLPLLILGALAILLVLAGAAGMVWQRTHPRDEPPAPA